MNTWTKLKKEIDAGLAPLQTVEVVLTQDEKEKVGLKSLRGVRTLIKKYLKNNGLEYQVATFRHPDDVAEKTKDPRDIIQVSNQKPLKGMTA